MFLWIEIGIVIAVIAVMSFGFFAWPAYLRRHPEKRGGKSATGGLVGGTDFVWHPEAAQAATELDEQQRLVVPAPTPDGDNDLAEGRIRLSLPNQGDVSPAPPAGSDRGADAAKTP